MVVGGVRLPAQERLALANTNKQKGTAMEHRETIFEMGDDKEWEDGDDSKIFDEGYSAGVIDAVAYLADVFEGVYDTDVFSRLGVSDDTSTPKDIPGFEGVQKRISDIFDQALGKKGV
jgi:hypothetical protein